MSSFHNRLLSTQGVPATMGTIRIRATGVVLTPKNSQASERDRQVHEYTKTLVKNAQKEVGVGEP